MAGRQQQMRREGRLRKKKLEERKCPVDGEGYIHISFSFQGLDLLL